MGASLSSVLNANLLHGPASLLTPNSGGRALQLRGQVVSRNGRGQSFRLGVGINIHHGPLGSSITAVDGMHILDADTEDLLTG
jgi:hypothetical protein